jgi:uncharacterized OsmC-like protein
VTAKSFEYSTTLELGGALRAERGEPLDLGPEWLPEHLVLAGVARCTLTSLRYYARDATVEASAEARGTVTQRDADRLYAFVEVEVAFDVRLDPEPDDLTALLERAERGCFVGNSLTAKPRYRWRVNGRDVR